MTLSDGRLMASESFGSVISTRTYGDYDVSLLQGSFAVSRASCNDLLDDDNFRRLLRNPSDLELGRTGLFQENDANSKDHFVIGAWEPCGVMVYVEVITMMSTLAPKSAAIPGKSAIHLPAVHHQ